MQAVALLILALVPPVPGLARESADALLQRCRPIDLHADTTYAVRVHHREPCGAELQAGPMHLRQVHADAQVYALWTRPSEDALQGMRKARGAVLRLQRCPGMASLEPGATRILQSFEGAEVLIGHPERLRPLGLFALALTWNRSNVLADAAKGRVLHHGLSAQGRRLVDLAGELGVLMDVSHASDQTARQILARSHLPVLATHSNARAVVEHPRNLPDDLIRAIAKSGGVVGLNAHCPFAAGKKHCKVADLVRQVQHVRAVGGDAVLALGLDFDGDIDAPTDLQHAGQLPVLVDALLDAGLPEATVCGLLGDNVRTVMRRVRRPLP
jgi:membrane dipeptidase